MTRKILNNKPIIKLNKTPSIRGDILSRISKIVDNLMEDSEIFKEIDKTKLIEFFSTLIEAMPSRQTKYIADDEFRRRIEKIMLIETMGGMLDGLGKKQTESFEEAIKRREFFK